MFAHTVSLLLCVMLLMGGVGGRLRLPAVTLEKSYCPPEGPNVPDHHQYVERDMGHGRF